MAHKHSDYGPSFSSSTVSEVEVILEVDEEEAGAKSNRFDKSEPGITDTWKYQGIPSHKGDVKQVPHCSYSGGDNKEEPELEENKAASVPQPQRRRPRIQFGLTALQVKELESVFEKNQYPDVITRYAASFRSLLFSVVHGLFLRCLLRAPVPSPPFEPEGMWAFTFHGAGCGRSTL